MVGNKIPRVSGNGFENRLDLPVGDVEFDGIYLGSGRPIDRCIDSGHLHSDEPRRLRHSTRVEPDVWVKVVPQRNRIEQRSYLEDVGPILFCGCQDINQSLLQPESDGNDEVGLVDAGHLTRGGLIVVRIGSCGHKHLDRGIGSDDVSDDISDDRRSDHDR